MMANHSGKCGRCGAYVPDDSNVCPMCRARFHVGMGPLAMILFVLFGVPGLALMCVGAGMLFFEFTGPHRADVLQFEAEMWGAGIAGMFIAWMMPRTKGKSRRGG